VIDLEDAVADTLSAALGVDITPEGTCCCMRAAG
jgi:hypothetical protein